MDNSLLDSAVRRAIVEHVATHGKSQPAATPGAWLSKIGGLTDVLHEWGYEPAVSTGTNRDKADVRLIHCPFRRTARAKPTVVRGIHRGLMHGAMIRLGELTTEIELLPFVEDDICVAHCNDMRQPPSHPAPTATTTTTHPDRARWRAARASARRTARPGT